MSNNNSLVIYEKSILGSVTNLLDNSLYSGKVSAEPLSILKAMMLALDYIIQKNDPDYDEKREYLEEKILTLLQDCEDLCYYKEVSEDFKSIYGSCNSQEAGYVVIANSIENPDFQENIEVPPGTTFNYTLPTDNVIVNINGQEMYNNDFNVYESIVINVQ